MKTEKLKNGYYRVRKTYEGQTYSVNFDHKPSQKEITLALSEKMSLQGTQMGIKGSVKEYANKYVAKCEKDNKSPSTIKGYNSIIKNTPLWFLDTQLSDVNDIIAQKVIDDYGETRSPKAVRNMYSLYHSVLAHFRPYLKLTVNLPAKEKKYEYQPSTKDIKAILKAAQNTRYYIPLRLASIGLRRGEICAITSADLSEDNILTINKAMIVDLNNKQVIKNCPKTDASNRRILITSDVADLIRQNEKAFEGNMHTINEYLHKVQDELKIPRFKLHMLRHFAAAYLLKLGFTSIQIEEYMGWEHGSTVMQKVYAYNLDPEERQKDIAGAFDLLTDKG